MAGQLSKVIQDFFGRRTQNMMDPVDLIELVFSWKQRIFRDQFEQNAAKSPHVHLLIVITIGHQTLWCPVPPGRDVIGIGLWTLIAWQIINEVTSAGAKIGQLGNITADKYILRLNVSVEYTFFVHGFNGFEHLKHDMLDPWHCYISVSLQVLIQVHVH